MKIVDHTDERGRKYKVRIPDTAPDSEAMFGIVLGPPDFDEIGLPEDIATRLHNTLFMMGIITYTDARKRRGDILGAIQNSLRLSTQAVFDIYVKEYSDG